MSAIFRAVLFQVVSWVFFAEVHSGDNSVNCSTTSGTYGHYFNGFESVETTNELAYGCATFNKRETLSKVYQENHIIDIKNNRAGDIYLNINGIPRRTTDSLPQYEKYHYKFALYSEKDVLWLVSLRNMLKSNVSYEFILSPGSHVSSRDGQNFRYREMKVDRRYMAAEAFLIVFKDDVFYQEKISSFSQMSSPQVAAINITVGPWQDVQQPSNFTSDCEELEEPYHSPTVSITKFRPSHSPSLCEPEVMHLEEESLTRLFFVDMKAGSYEDIRKKQPINLEILGKEVTEHGKVIGGKTIIVLRSQRFTQFLVNIARELQASKIKFVIGKNVQLEGEGSAIKKVENLDFLGDNYTTLKRSVEEQFECTLISYVQYDSRTNLIFLSLSEPDKRIGTQVVSQRLIEDFQLYVIPTLRCERGPLLKIPLSALKRYGLTSKNVRVSVDSEICKHEENSQFITYSLVNYGAGVHNQSLQLKVTFTFRTQEKHLLPLPVNVKESEEVDTILGCPESSAIDTPPSEKFVTRKGECNMNTFYIKISDVDMQHLDVSGISQCEEGYYNGHTEFKFERDAESNCRAAFRDGVFQIVIPLKSNDDGASSKTLEFSCKPIEVEASYDLEVFEDFDMRNRVLHDPINVKPKEKGTDATTYHIKISLVSNDPSLAVYISECSLKEGSRVVQRLIKNNCLASSAVSFVRSSFGSTSQHFAVSNVAGFLQDNRRLRIECETSGCSVNGTYHSTQVIKPPQCLHLHGDGCTQDDINSPIRLASYLQKTVSSNNFRVVLEPEVDSSSLSIKAPILVILAFVAFIIGCIFVGVIWLISRRYNPETARGQRNVEKSASSVCAECGSGQSTESTKTDGSSFSSFFCLKSVGKSSSSSATSSKDSFEMAPFIPSSTSAATTQCRDIASSTRIAESVGKKSGSSKRNTRRSQTSLSNGSSSNRGDLSVPVEMSASCSRSSLAPTRVALGNPQRAVLSPQEQQRHDQQPTLHVFSGDSLLNSCPVTQDEFARLKEEAV